MAITAGLAAFAFTIAASAASLGGINSSDFFAWSDTVNISVPTTTPTPPVASDTFDGCTNELDGWVDSVGNVWTSHEGNWKCVANSVARNERRVTVAHASVETGHFDNIAVSTDIVRISTQKNKSGPGLALFDDGAHFVSVLYKREQGRLVIGVMAPSGYRELFAVVPISDYDSATLEVTIQQPVLTVLLNGLEQWTFDLLDPNGLSGDEWLIFEGNTRHGLASDNDNWSHFGSFTVETLP